VCPFAFGNTGLRMPHREDHPIGGLQSLRRMPQFQATHCRVPPGGGTHLYLLSQNRGTVTARLVFALTGFIAVLALTPSTANR
jgi:hypothetical protein